MIGDVWFADLREERKDESARVRVRRRKGRHPGTTLRVRKTSLPLCVPPSRIRSSSLLPACPLSHNCSLTRHPARAAQMRQPGKLEGFGVGSQFSPSPPPPPSSSFLQVRILNFPHPSFNLCLSSSATAERHPHFFQPLRFHAYFIPLPLPLCLPPQRQ